MLLLPLITWIADAMLMPSEQISAGQHCTFSGTHRPSGGGANPVEGEIPEDRSTAFFSLSQALITQFSLLVAHQTGIPLQLARHSKIHNYTQVIWRSNAFMLFATYIQSRSVAGFLRGRFLIHRRDLFTAHTPLLKRIPTVSSNNPISMNKSSESVPDTHQDLPLSCSF